MLSNAAGASPIRWFFAFAGLAVGFVAGWALVIVTLHTNAAQRPQAFAPYQNASIVETFRVEFAGSNVSKAAFTGAFADLLAAARVQRAGVQIRPDYENSSSASGVGDGAYLSAFDDAQHKASLLARRAGAPLGAVQSISEGYGGQPPPPGGNMALKGNASPRTLAGGPIVLEVVYRLGDGARTVSVLGFASAGKRPVGTGTLASTRLVVEINARAGDLAAAQREIAPYEALVRRAAAKSGLPESAVGRAELSLNVF
jgi:hypothetical protein